MNSLTRTSWTLLAAALLAACGSIGPPSATPTVTVTRPQAAAPPSPPTATATTTTTSIPPVARTAPAPAPTRAARPPLGAAESEQSAARRFAANYLAYSYGFAPLSSVQPAAASLRTYLSQGRHVPSTPQGTRPKVIGLKFAPLAGGYVGVVVTYSTSTSVAAFAFDLSTKSGHWQAEQLEG